MAVELSIVSYLNTLPFVFGLELWNSKNPDSSFLLKKQDPANCARSLKDGIVDIGLVPVAALIENQEVEIITNYCIGTQNAVDSVLLLSNNPIHEITEIILDYQSKTSNILVKILAKYFWKISPSYSSGTQGYESTIEKSQGAVVIGDKAFTAQKQYLYCYDLGLAWNEMTGLPFVFACWAQKKTTDQTVAKNLNTALKLGIHYTPSVIEANKNKYPDLDLEDYLTRKISYAFDEEKRNALELYLSYANSIK